MRVIKPGEKLTNEELKKYAMMAAEAYTDDPVHCYAVKNRKRRKTLIYHFMMVRLKASNGEDYIYIDDEERGMCVWRQAQNEYGVTDFLTLPDWFFLYWYWPCTLKLLIAYSCLDVKKFRKDCWIISPVFVDPKRQGKGIATALIKAGMEDLSKLGYTFGLEAQDEGNVKFYEKLGFKTFDEDYFKKGNIHHYYMSKED